MIRRILSAFLAAIMLTAILGTALPASGAGVAADGSGGAVPAKYFTEAVSAASADYWVTGGGTSSSPASGTGDLRIFSATGKASVTANFHDKISVYGYREVGIYARSLSEKLCTAVLTVRSGDVTTSVTVQLPTGEEYYVFTPLPEGVGLIDSVSFTASVPGGRNADGSISVSLMISGVALSTEDHTATARKYSAFDVEGVGDDGTLSDGGILAGSPVITDGSAEAYALRVRLRGTVGGFSARFAPDGEDFGVCGSAVISEDRNTYLFRTMGITPDSAYRLEFTGIGDSDVHVDGVDLIPIPAEHVYDSLGNVSKCGLSDGTVGVSGTITRDAAVKYIDSQVCLYEIPMWQDAASALAEEPVMSIRMSTTFSFALSITEDYSAFTAYVVAIKDGDDVHPLCDPIYPTVGHHPATEPLSEAAFGISVEDAFCAGYDKYVIDIDTDALFLDSIPLNSSAFTYDGYPYYPDTALTAELASKVAFLDAAGIGVIFRLGSGSTMDSFDAAGSRRLAAAVAYLYRMYEPYGFIDALPYGEQGSLSLRIERKCGVARLISAVADGCAVFIPVDGSAEGETAAWLIGQYISQLPTADLRILVTGGSASLDGITAAAADGGYTSHITVTTDSAETTDGLPRIVCFGENERPDLSAGVGTVYPLSDKWSGDGAVSLWDFTGAYHTGGFTVPAGPTGLFTNTNDVMAAHTGIAACRTLSTVLDQDSDVILAESSAPMDLSVYSSVRFLVSVITDSAVSLDIVFVSGDERAVFTTSFERSGVFAPVCELSQTGIASRIDRIAIVLREGDQVELGIATVTASCGDPEEEGGVFITQSAVITDSPDGPDADMLTPYRAYLAAGTLLVITILVFVSLSLKRPTE